MTPAQQKLTAAAGAAVSTVCRLLGRLLPAADSEAFYDHLAGVMVEDLQCTPRAADRAIRIAIVRLAYAGK